MGRLDEIRTDIGVLSAEYLLVQAWKKTAVYMRRHNWFADTLDLDRATLDLEHFLNAVSEAIAKPEDWEPDPIRIVPAPKTQRWEIDPQTQKWRPTRGSGGSTLVRLRPLAHVSLRDQVAATALMLGLADRVETLQGDPTAATTDRAVRERVTSYGNRLFCDQTGEGLRHRWGSSRVYRGFYQDYQVFLRRPDIVASTLERDGTTRVVVVSADLSCFCDRVRPALLAQKIASIQRPEDDPRVFDLARRIFNWTWDQKDVEEVASYAAQESISDFSSVALPQGLVAAGFFSNVVLLDLDARLRTSIETQIAEGILLRDAIRYVDDLRLVLTAEPELPLTTLEEHIKQWLRSLLEDAAPGLILSESKTRAALPEGDERPLVRQSRTMRRIQRGVSGGFDVQGGEEVLAAVQGLIRAQERYSKTRLDDQAWRLAPVADVRDDTVARFAAGTFRRTVRVLRPMLPPDENVSDRGSGERVPTATNSIAQLDLDEQIRVFAAGLVENWVADPSNVRLLRIALDLWPEAGILAHVLKLLRPFTEKGGPRKASRRVAWYCLSEILRAG